MEYPRVLIISNNCLTQNGSNGRTLRNFLLGWPKEKLAQFYIHRQEPDFTMCSNYYCVTDKQALNAFCCKGRSGGVVDETTFSDGTAVMLRQYSNRTALTMLARELIWNSKRWGYGAFRRWVDAFRPEVLLMQAGDCGFMYKLARKLAKAYNIPLVIYNSEGYYFKQHDYFRAKGLAHLLYPVHHRLFARQFRKVMHTACHAIYICDALLEDYGKEFTIPAETIYTATTLTPAEKQPHEGVVVSYLGNLGVGRHEPLVEIGNALQEISPELKLNIYGKTLDPRVQEALESCPGICMKGFVPYEQVVEQMQQSDLLIHSENQSPFYREDLKYGFSTKIADSLASGTCFLLYAPEELACARYLREREAAYVVTQKQELKDTLRLLVENPAARSRYLDNAAKAVKENHQAEVGIARFQEILRKAAQA